MDAHRSRLRLERRRTSGGLDVAQFSPESRRVFLAARRPV
jgi:hypothetical protein